MKKSTKGALAVGAAALLLIAVPTTVAYWTDEESVAGGTVSSGNLTLTMSACGQWAHAEDGAAVTAIVPGDLIVKTCSGTLTLVGEHIGATVAISDASLTSLGGLADELTISAQLTAPGATVTSPGTHEVEFDISVDFPYGTVSTPDPTTGADNDSKLDTATLNNIEVVAVQTHDETP